MNGLVLLLCSDTVCLNKTLERGIEATLNSLLITITFVSFKTSLPLQAWPCTKPQILYSLVDYLLAP